jgi:hypothetical protein
MDRRAAIAPCAPGSLVSGLTTEEIIERRGEHPVMPLTA